MADQSDQSDITGVADRPAHTPGPWHAEFGEQFGYDCMTHAWTIYAANRKIITDIDLGSYGQEPCDYAFRSAEAAANAWLIAAAPDLLAACKLLLESHDASCKGEDCPLYGIDLTRAAIKKAIGG